MKVVVAGASTLLAREADPAAGLDDDDDGGSARPAARPTAKVEPEPARAEAGLTTGSTETPTVDRN